MPKVIIPEVGEGREYTDIMNIPIGYHKASITAVTIVTPDDQYNKFDNYQYRLILSFPQFAEEGKSAPGLFYNMTVLSLEKDGDGVEIPGSYRCAIFPGGRSKAIKVLEAAGIEIKPGLEITPELLLNKEVAVSVSPYTNKKGEKIRIAKEVLSLSEIEDQSSKPTAKKTKKKKPQPTDPDLYDKALAKFKGNTKKLEDYIREKEELFNGLVSREGILVMIQNGK